MEIVFQSLSISCRYHPACVGMTIEEAKNLDHFVCSECSSEAQTTFLASPANDGKVRLLVLIPTEFGYTLILVNFD